MLHDISHVVHAIFSLTHPNPPCGIKPKNDTMVPIMVQSTHLPPV